MPDLPGGVRGKMPGKKRQEWSARTQLLVILTNLHRCEQDSQHERLGRKVPRQSRLLLRGHLRPSQLTRLLHPLYLRAPLVLLRQARLRPARASKEKFLRLYSAKRPELPTQPLLRVHPVPTLVAMVG